MSTGKYLSLEEAQQEKLLERFANEHPSKGDRKRFDKLLTAMSSIPGPPDQESDSSRSDEEG